MTPKTDSNSLLASDQIYHPVAIIGAGPLGVAIGRELLQHGFRDFTVFEKEQAAGGTWHIQDAGEHVANHQSDAAISETGIGQDRADQRQRGDDGIAKLQTDHRPQG